MPRPQPDVAVVGGGPAGSALAIALARQGIRVRLIEAVPERKLRVGETVPPELEHYLRELTVWDAFAQGGHLPSGGICSAWGGQALTFQDAFSRPHGGGWHLDRPRFDAMLLAEADRAGAEVVTGARVIGIGAPNGPAQEGMGVARPLFIRAADGQIERVTTSLVVDATGRSASIARRFGSRRLGADRLVAIYAGFALADRMQDGDYTLVEAVENGWWYTTRIPGERAIAAFFTDAAVVRRDGLSRPGRWHQHLRRTRHVHELLGHPPRPDALAVTSAATHCLQRIVGDGWLAVGDAATAWDPLTSAGIVHGVRTGIEAATAIIQLWSGERNALAVYERQIQQRFTRYLLERRAYYRLEARWPRSEFWQRRQSSEAAPRHHTGSGAVVTFSGRRSRSPAYQRGDHGDDPAGQRKHADHHRQREGASDGIGQQD